MIRIKVGLRLFGLALAAAATTAAGAHAQGLKEMLLQHPEILQQHPPLSAPVGQELLKNPEAARILTSPQSLPPPGSTQAPESVPSQQGPAPQTEPCIAVATIV